MINIGSLTSELARATVSPYTVAKGGIKMLSKAMAAEWGEHGIQANTIGPGYMLTEMNTALVENPSFDGWVKGRTPARRWGRPEELVGTAILLASAASCSAALAAPALLGHARAATSVTISTSFPNEPKFSTARI